MHKYLKMKYLTLILIAITLAFTSLAGKPDKKYYDEKYRPQYHFTAEKNWMSNPGGLVFYSGEYHLFYQYNPNGKEWGFMHWGHAVSKDLIHWQHLPVAISPDEDSKDKSHCTAFPGCALVDENNVTGLQEGSEKTIVAFYTSSACGQRLAYSNDKGRTWKKYTKNPLIPFAKDDAHDPKVFFHKPSGNWIMVISRKPDGDEKKQGVSIFTSKNLIDWEMQSHITGFYDSPDLFELPVDGDKGKTKWVMLGGSGEYKVGTFDGKLFIAETPKKNLDYGKNFYASQTWSNLPEGKLIQLAWMKGGEYPEMPFNGQMNFPCELSLRTGKSGPVLCRKPVDAINTLHESGITKKKKNIIPGLRGNLVGGISGDAIHIKTTLNPENSDGFGFIVRNGKKEVGTEIRYDTNKKILECLGGRAIVEPKNGLVHFEILIDRASIEIFANDGEIVLTSCFTPAENDKELTFWSQGGEVMVEELEAYELKSVWRK